MDRLYPESDDAQQREVLLRTARVFDHY
jgi:hypothetical protein